MWDRAPYFRASAVTDLAARDDLKFVRLPAYSPELNSIEKCWRQNRPSVISISLYRVRTLF
ncbi:hypothetical protein C2R22_23820 (plasmid) [Salinigranum rubrum]|uniref:Tc1-like transposase DDE domain-containing protein n=1 Tax=Salinigranum rubrum TaxID=755307 RepID=A0A2I8VRN9_9EURY|nr:hypothetical protein C2R22_23820 [Salinigranum rubrum]